ncbi:MAG: type II secretion system protein GspE [Candidatus Glassbacteria bacterium RBG_16_58_8]|uniref:protein-secreting ATPase n=1 Tax=Candidatus Glassbacteria bacterium RBG_16_58_8 TaxID=1817866 RepID=A0A1F5YDI9_9BACT|nr:MAG: type II secretion system protein GspE [Candidatus Glassbacteria bacterium RBG_16_58_8]
MPSIVKIEDEIDESLNLRISPKYMEEHRFLPLRMKDGLLRVAFADPQDLYTIDDLRSLLRLEIEPVAGSPDEILEAIRKYYGEGVDTIEKMVKDMSEEELTLVEGRGNGIQDLRDLASQAPVIKLVNLIIMEALKKRASDIHLEAMEDQLRVRYRIDGILQDVSSPAKRFQAAIISRIKIIAELNIAERRLAQDGRFRMKIKDKDIDFRVSIVPTLHGESVVIRILDKSSILMSLEELGFSSEMFRAVNRLITRPHGIILVTGPTGSGKTTTLYAVLEKINSPEKKIITLEDPVEYHLPGTNQIPIKPKIGFTFATGLRSIIRQDPDIIMIGEMRDLETAEIAIHSSLTGHLVFSTIHTNDAPGGLTRMIDMGVEAYLVSSAVEGILAQRLIRRICPACKEEVQPDWRMLEELGLTIDSHGSPSLYRGHGCNECNYTGYRGRVGIFELLIMNDELQHLILENTPLSDLKDAAVKGGMTTLRHDGWEKTRSGETTLEEILRVTQEEE